MGSKHALVALPILALLLTASYVRSETPAEVPAAPAAESAAPAAEPAMTPVAAPEPTPTVAATPTPAAAPATPAVAAVAEVVPRARAGDKAVTGFIEDVQKSTKQFERSLDSDLRNGVIRGATTEVNVANYLKDFSTDLDRLHDRFKPKYSASAEVGTVLSKAGGIDRFVKSQPPSMKGRSEWDVASASLNQLAAAYGTTFPTPAEGAPRRINDAEIMQATDALTTQAQAYRKALKEAFTKEESAELATAQKSIDALSTAAKNLKGRVKAGKPASGEAAVVAKAFTATPATVSGRALPESASKAWNGITTAVGTINQAFGVPTLIAETQPDS
jgi:hypothetical protein